jgi:hypothetical protein
MERHERGIHALLPDADVANVADVRFGWAPRPAVRREPAAIN